LAHAQLFPLFDIHLTHPTKLLTLRKKTVLVLSKKVIHITNKTMLGTKIGFSLHKVQALFF
jgi:hypothetical protein